MFKIILIDPEEITNSLHWLRQLGIEPYEHDFGYGTITFTSKVTFEAAKGVLNFRGVSHVTEEVQET